MMYTLVFDNMQTKKCDEFLSVLRRFFPLSTQRTNIVATSTSLLRHYMQITRSKLFTSFIKYQQFQKAFLFDIFHAFYFTQFTVQVRRVFFPRE
jgi:hypothetical protein